MCINTTYQNTMLYIPVLVTDCNICIYVYKYNIPKYKAVHTSTTFSACKSGATQTCVSIDTVYTGGTILTGISWAIIHIW